MITYGRQDISQEDIDAVVAVLRSDSLTQGPQVPLFEQAVAEKVSAKYAVAVNSATSALHLACLSLGLGPGDWLWTTPVTFVASANCGLYCGAQVDFVDVDPQTYNLSVEKLEEKLTTAEATGKLPKVVIPVHLCGQSCDMAAIHKLSKKYGFKIIEDASHAIGGGYKNFLIGNCRFSDITVFSFHPVKIITTGEGGLALTNNSELAERMANLRSHGIVRDQLKMQGISDGPWYYQQIALGLNYRMTEIQAALGVSQLARLDEFVKKRHFLARRYDEALVNVPILTPWQHPDTYSAYHLYVVRCDAAVRLRVFERLRLAGIGVNVHYIPVHTQPYYQKMGFQFGDFPVAEAYYAEAISLPLYPALSQVEQDKVIFELSKAIAA